MRAIGADTVFVRSDNLSGLNVPNKGRADGVQGTALRGKNDGTVLHRAHTERPKAVRIPHGDQLGGRGDHQGVGAFQHVHGGYDRFLDAGGFKTRAHDGVGDDLRIRRGVKDRTLFLKGISNVPGIGQIAVMRQCQPAFVMVDEQRLQIALAVGTGGRVTHMTHGNIAFSQIGESCGGKHLVDKARIPAGGKDPIVVDDDARALLPAVLQGKQPVIHRRRQVFSFGGKNTENTTLFTDVVFIGPCGIRPGHWLPVSA